MLVELAQTGEEAARIVDRKVGSFVFEEAGRRLERLQTRYLTRLHLAPEMI